MKPSTTITEVAISRLVHGAGADGSSWDRVVPLLTAKGYHVVAVHEPLTSLADEVAAVKRVIHGFGDRERMRRSFARAFGQTPQSVRNAKQTPDVLGVHGMPNVRVEGTLEKQTVAT